MFEENYTGKIDDQGEVYSRNSKYRIEEEDIKNGDEILDFIVNNALIKKIGSGKINLPNKHTHIFIRIILGEFSDKSLKKSVEESLKAKLRMALKNDLGKYIKGLIETSFFIIK